MILVPFDYFSVIFKTKILHIRAAGVPTFFVLFFKLLSRVLLDMLTFSIQSLSVTISSLCCHRINFLGGHKVSVPVSSINYDRYQTLQGRLAGCSGLCRKELVYHTTDDGLPTLPHGAVRSCSAGHTD